MQREGRGRSISISSRVTLAPSLFFLSIPSSYMLRLCVVLIHARTSKPSVFILLTSSRKFLHALCFFSSLLCMQISPSVLFQMPLGPLCFFVSLTCLCKLFTICVTPLHPLFMQVPLRPLYFLFTLRPFFLQYPRPCTFPVTFLLSPRPCTFPLSIPPSHTE